MTTCSDSCDGAVLLVEPEAVLFSVDGGMTFTSASLLHGFLPGVYQLAVVNSSGCLALANAQVVPPEVIADFILSTTDTSGAGQQLLLTNYSMNAVAYDWQIGSMGFSLAEDPVILVPIDGLGPQQICLTAFDGNGCLDVACQNINILGPDVAELPNVFSPNGNGQNDVFAQFAAFRKGLVPTTRVEPLGPGRFRGGRITRMEREGRFDPMPRRHVLLDVGLPCIALGNERRPWNSDFAPMTGWDRMP